MDNNKTIDNKIVSLDFDCEKFKRNVKDSEDVIDSFNKKVDTMGSSKSGKNNLERLNDDANELSKDGLDKVDKSVDSVKLKFDTLGIVGKRVLENITDMAVNAGTQFLKSLTVDQVTESWAKYEKEVESVQLLVTSLSSYIGLGSGAKKEYTNEELEDYSYAKLEKLKWFSDETSYSYSAMTNALSNFVRSGYSDINKTITAIEGIATAAASAGVSIQQSEELFGVWSTIISGGSMGTLQFDQLNKTYKAFTGDFKNLLLEAAAEVGTIKDLGDGWYQTAEKGDKFNMASMRGYLSQKIITGDVALKALESYGALANKLNEMWEKEGIRATEGLEELRKANEEATTEKQIKALKDEGKYFTEIQLNAFEAAQACKTYADAIGATQDAVSTQMAGIWKSLTGGYSEAKDLWSELCDYLYELFVPFVHFLNKAMEYWHAWGGWETLFSVDEDKYGAVWELFNALLEIVNAIQEGFGRVFPIFSTFNDETEDFTTNVKKLAGYLNYYTHKFADWVKSILPSDDELESISNFAAGIASVANTIWNALRFAFSFIVNLATAVWKITEPVRYLASYLVNMLTIFNKTDDTGANSFTDALMRIANAIQKFLWPIVYKIINFVNESKPVIKTLFESLEKLLGILLDIANPLISKGLDIINGAFKALGSVLKKVDFAKILGGIQYALQAFGNFIGPIFEFIGGVFDSFVENISKFGSDVLKTVDNLAPTIASSVKTIVDVIWVVLSSAAVSIYEKLMAVDWTGVVDGLGRLLMKIMAALNVGMLPIIGYFALMTVRDLLWSIEVFMVGFKQSIADAAYAKYIQTLLEAWGKFLLEITAAIAILSFIPTDKLIKGFIAVGTILAMITGATIFFDKAFGASKVVNLGSTMKNMLAQYSYILRLKTLMSTLITTLVVISLIFIAMSGVIKKQNLSIGEMWSVAGIIVTFMTAAFGIFAMVYMILGGLKFNDLGGQVEGLVPVGNGGTVTPQTFGRTSFGKKILAFVGIMFTLAIATAILSLSFSEIASAISTSGFNQGEAWSVVGMLVVFMSIMSVLSALILAFANAMAKNTAMMPGQSTQMLADMGMFLGTMLVTSLVVKVMASSMSDMINTIHSASFNQGEAWSVVGMMIVIMAAVGGMLFAITKMPYADWTKLLSFSGTMVILSLVTKILVSSFSDIADSFENLNPGYMWQSLGILVVIMGSIAGILMLISNFVKTVNVGKIFSMAAVLVIVSLAITILMSSVAVIGETFNTVNPGYMWQAVAILFVMAGVIGGLIIAFSQLIRTIKNVGGILAGALAFIVVSITINSLVTSLTSLAQAVNGIDIGAMWGVVGMMGAIIGVVMGLMILLGELAGKNAWILLGMVVAVAGLLVIGPCIQQMADAFNTLMPSIVRIAAIDTASIWKAVAVISVLMFAFTLFGSTGVAAGIGLVQIGAGMYIIGKALSDGLLPALERMASIEWESIGAAAGKLAVLGLALSAFAVGGILAIVLSAGIWILGLALSNGLIPAVQQLGEVDWEVIGSAAGKMSLLGLALAAFGIGASLAALPVLVIAGALGFLAIVATPFVNAITGLIGACESFITAMSGIDKKAIPVIVTLINTIPILFTAIASGCIAFIDTLGEGAQRSEKAIMKIITAICNAVTGSSHAITKAITTLTLDVIFMTLDAIEAVLPRLKDHIIFITDTILQFIIESIFSNTLTIIQSVWQGLIDIFNGVADLVEQKGDQLRVAFKRFIASVSKFAEKCLEDGDFLKEKMQPIFDLLGNVITDFIDPLATKLGELVSGAFTSFSLGLATGGVSAIISNAADKIVGIFSGSLKDGFEKADISTDIYSLKDYARSLTGDELQGFNATVNKIAQIIGVSVDQVKAMNADSKDLQEGILKLEKALPTLGFSEHGEAIAQQFITGYKSRMRIESPSKEMFSLGGFTMEGLINGIKEKAGELWNTIKEIGGNVLDIFRNALGLDKQDKDSQQGFDFLSLLGLGGDEKGESLEDKIRNSLGLGENESGTDIIKNIFGENDFNLQDWIGGDDFNLDDWMGGDIGTNSSLFDGIDESLSAASNSAEEASSSGDDDSTSKKSSSKKGTSSSNANGRNGGQMYQNPQPGYTIIQNNYSPKALNSTEIYRRTKSTFAKLEGIKSV